MTIHVANLFEADRRTALAAEAITQGMLIKISDDGNGVRKALKVADADAALLVPGNYGVAYKVTSDEFEVSSSTVLDDQSRVLAIASGDAIVELGRGSKIEYSADLLHSSLDPARSGATATVGQTLAVKSAQWCTTGTGSAITSPVVGRVHAVRGTTVVIELL